MEGIKQLYAMRIFNIKNILQILKIYYKTVGSMKKVSRIHLTWKSEGTDPKIPLGGES